MSLYNKSKWDFFVNNNYNDIIQLNKFKNYNNTDCILNNAKLSPNDIYKLINLFSNNLKIYEIGKLKTYHVLKSKDGLDTNTYENIKNKINLNNLKYDFFEQFWTDNNTNTRTGTISMTSCDNVSFESRTSYNNILNNYNNIGNIAINPNYFGKQINNFGRIVKFNNNHKLRILYCNPKNKLGRLFFRKAITKIILGEDYKFDFKEGCYQDGCLGQEIIYYFLEIYNYDRYHKLTDLFDDLNKDKEKLHINLPPDYKFEQFYNDESVNIEYPSLDGIYYHDDSSVNIDKQDIPVHGTEIIIFIPDKFFNIESSIFINDIINNNIKKYTFDNNIKEFHAYITNNINNPNNLDISLTNLTNINIFLNKECIK